MRGIFRIYRNGELISTQSNLITDEGKKLILRRLSDQNIALGGAIGIGTSDSPALVTDTRLGFEIDRVVVDSKVADFTDFAVIYKATLPKEAVYGVHELGVWTQYSNVVAGSYGSRVLTKFNTETETWTNLTADTTQSRASDSSGRVTVPASTTVSARNTSSTLDLSGYSSSDTVTLAFYKPDNNVVALSVVFETTTTGGIFSSSEIDISALPVGYNVVSVTKGSLGPTGSADWATIDQFGVDARAAGTGGYVILDGMRIEDTDTVSPDYILVSHAILGTPVVKTDDAPLEIEYALGFDVA